MYKSMRKKLKEEECVVQDLKKKEEKMLQIAIMKKLLKNNEWNWEVEICRRGAGASGCYCCGAVQKMSILGRWEELFS
jgi:hypothetical protein